MTRPVRSHRSMGLAAVNIQQCLFHLPLDNSLTSRAQGSSSGKDNGTFAGHYILRWVCNDIGRLFSRTNVPHSCRLSTCNMSTTPAADYATRGPEAIAICITFASVSGLTVLGRFYTRTRIVGSGIGLAEYLILISWVSRIYRSECRNARMRTRRDRERESDGWDRAFLSRAFFPLVLSEKHTNNRTL